LPIPKEDIVLFTEVHRTFFTSRTGQLSSQARPQGCLKPSLFLRLHRKCQSLQLTCQINVHHRDAITQTQRCRGKIENPVDLTRQQSSRHITCVLSR